MPSYFSPGVYVEEVSSGIHPIVGVGTNTTGFVGIAPTRTLLTSNVLVKPLAKVDSGTIDLATAGLATPPGAAILPPGQTSHRVVRQVWVKDPSTLVTAPIPRGEAWDVENDKVVMKGAYRAAATARLDYVVRAAYTLDVKDAPDPLPQRLVVERELAAWDATAGRLTTWDGTAVQPSGGAVEISLPDGPVDPGTLAFRAGSTDVTARFEAATRVLTLDDGTIRGLADGDKVTGSYVVLQQNRPAKLLTPKLCTSFSDFTRGFGEISAAPEQNRLAHAVHGFFDNGGTRCWVVQARDGEVPQALDKLGLIDEIALVAAPGLSGRAVYGALTSHCENLGDRFAILDCPQDVGTTDGSDNLTRLDPTLPGNVVPPSSNRVAFYFPWIEVFDPPTKLADPDGEATIAVPPSGHLAGLYARVDQERGVHKAPANEVVRGALGLPARISRPQQAGLNPHGINVIRELNEQILVWGARTLGGDANGEWKYVNVRRLLLFLEESIDEGTQWVVFEPNEPALWAKITRNVTAFLTNVWRSGALFGASPQEAFYVKCNAETNPPDVRERGQVITEVGVAPVRPAEFVIFRVSQWAGQTGK